VGGSCPCVEKLRTVLPLTVGIRDGAVQVVSIEAVVVEGGRRPMWRAGRTSLRLPFSEYTSPALGNTSCRMGAWHEPRARVREKTGRFPGLRDSNYLLVT
jgi:hypothetical protein